MQIIRLTASNAPDYRDLILLFLRVTKNGVSAEGAISGITGAAPKVAVSEHPAHESLDSRLKFFSDCNCVQRELRRIGVALQRRCDGHPRNGERCSATRIF
jgi:hypothetical protein